MKQKSIAAILLIIVLSLVLSGCATLPDATRVLSGEVSAATAQLNRVIALNTPVAGTQVSTAPGQPATINIAPGADVETEINESVYEKVNPSVVYIENQTRLTRSTSGGSSQALPESSGSGWVWDDRGYIVTNNHVVEGADRLEVTFSDGVSVPAELVGTDPGSDLAVIKVDPDLQELVPAEQGIVEDVRVGGRAIAIGNPFGLVGTMTTGIVSALGRSLSSDPSNPGSFSIPQVIQTDAAINPGNSGGPLLNERGQVIGVNFQIRSEAGSNSGVGFAIPINIVQRVVPALIEEGKYQHAYLGIRGQTYSPAWADALDLPEDARGAYISEVVQNGPAARGGLRGATNDTDLVLGLSVSGPVYLQSGGDLVTAIDDRPVKTMDDILVYLEDAKSPGDKVVLTVLRAGGKEAKVTVTLAARPTTTQ